MAASYLGTIPILVYVDIWCSRPTPQVANSQLYHCDWEAERQLKVFVHCSDVSEASGPLTVIPADKSKQLRDEIHYTYGGSRAELADETVAEVVGLDDEVSFTGPPGTVVAVDTSRCFHYGSRVKEAGNWRVVTVIQYLAPTAFKLPLRATRGAPFRHLEDHGLSELQRLVLGHG